MLFKKLPVLILVVVASGLSGQSEIPFLGKWMAYPHFEIYGMGFNNANNTATCISDKDSELYHFKEDGTLIISGYQYAMGVFTDGDKEASEITDITSGVQYRWSHSHNPQCLFLERENGKSSVLIFSLVDPGTLLVTMQDIHANGLPAPQFKVFLFKRR